MTAFCAAGGAAFSSSRNDWETPQSFFDRLNERFGFTLDAAASESNHKVDDYFTKEDDALTRSWGGVVFCNPPYGRDIAKWVKKAHDEAQSGNATVVMLIPARTDTSYWHDYIFGVAEVEFVRGRLKFELGGVAKESAPFPSAVVIYKRAKKGNREMNSLYLIGGITGYPNDNREEFERVARELERAGYYVDIPHFFVYAGTEWSKAMRMSICQMLATRIIDDDPCYSGVAMLDNWKESKGATIEHDLCEAIGMPVKPWREWLE